MNAAQLVNVINQVDPKSPPKGGIPRGGGRGAAGKRSPSGAPGGAVTTEAGPQAGGTTSKTRSTRRPAKSGGGDQDQLGEDKAESTAPSVLITAPAVPGARRKAKQRKAGAK